MDKLRLLIKAQGSFGASVTQDQELAPEHIVAFVEEKNTSQRKSKWAISYQDQKPKKQKTKKNLT